MQYEFITNLTEEKYNKIIEKSKYVCHKSNKDWNILENNNNIYYLALKKKKTFLSCAKAEINLNKKDKILNISNINFLKNDKIINSLFINEIIRFAKDLKVYKIKLSSYDEITNLKIKKINQHSILTLYNNAKFYRKDYFKKIFKFDESNLLCFNNKLKEENILELQKIINLWNINLNFDLKKLINTYKSNCSIICEKIDLIYYLNQLDSKESNLDTATINELINEFGEEMIVGFAIILFPTNKNAAFCISLTNIDAFQELPLKKALIIETINKCLNKKYKQIIFTDQIITDQIINNYEYEITLKKFRKFILKITKKED